MHGLLNGSPTGSSVQFMGFSLISSHNHPTGNMPSGNKKTTDDN